MRVLVAMSGGVDSSVAAALLRRDGHEVEGATLKLWGGESDSGCCSVADVDDARRVADTLGIEHHTFGFAAEFDEAVVGPYVDAHRRGLTPNPCVACNRSLKFGALTARAERLGFDAVATGHHARVRRGADARLRVARGADRAKDQSYVLAGLPPAALEQVLLPVGALTKAEVRAEASRLGLRIAGKPESQDVCFITRAEGRAGFLAERLELTPGRAVDTEGVELGRLGAVELVTVGQRRGLGLPGGSAPRYALDVDPGRATVVVGLAADRGVAVQPVTGLEWAAAPVTGELDVQVSAHGRPRPAQIVPGPGDEGEDDGEGGGEGEARIEWRAPQVRAAPGQLVVAYVGDEVVGWATAARTGAGGI